MKINEYTYLSNNISENLMKFDFTSKEIKEYESGLNFIKLWERKTWNTNRGVALISYDDKNIDVGKYAKKLKKVIGALLGYKPIIYPLGLQLIICVENIDNLSNNLYKFVDKINTQTVILQSIFVVDFIQNKYNLGRTWGQYITGRFQDSIENAIKNCLRT